MARIEQIYLPPQMAARMPRARLGVDSWSEVNPNLWGLLGILGCALAVGVVSVFFIESRDRRGHPSR
jgi:hypothetical protein